jgi:outer membrane lipoprotein SlyB
MKKLLATFMCLVILSMAALPAAAQTRSNRRYARAAAQRQYDYERSRERSVWEQHRDKITTAGGAVGGALLGGLVGGKKGALIGAITGGAGAAIYTYKVREKDRRY